MKRYLLIAALLVLAACSAQAPAETADAPQAPATPTDTTTDTQDDTTQTQDTSASASPEVIEIEAGNWYFSPDTVQLEPGQEYTLRVTSVAGTHGLAVPELGVDLSPISAGETMEATFTAPESGTFTTEGFCNVFCGRGHSDMRMTFTTA